MAGSFDPTEWLGWLYGKYFVNHTVIGAVVVCVAVCVVVALMTLGLYLRAVDKYEEQHPQLEPNYRRGGPPINSDACRRVPNFANCSAAACNFIRAGKTTSCRRACQEIRGTSSRTPRIFTGHGELDKQEAEAAEHRSLRFLEAAAKKSRYRSGRRRE